MKPELACREAVSAKDSPYWKINEIGQHRPKKQEPHVHLGISEDPPEQPEACSDVPEEHRSADKNPAAMNTPGDLVIEGLLLFGWRQGHVTSATDTVIERGDGNTLLDPSQLLVDGH